MRSKLIWLLVFIVCIAGCVIILFARKPEDDKAARQAPPASVPRTADSAKSGLPAEPASPPAVSASDGKHAGLTGLSPTDAKVTSKENQSDQLINAWRDAVIAKDPKKIEQLGLAVKGLGEASIPFLRKLAQEDTNERVRAFAARMLGRMRNTELAQMFRYLLENDKSPFVRENAAWALGELNDSRSIDKLQMIAENDESEQVRSAAKKAIETINNTTKKE